MRDGRENLKKNDKIMQTAVDVLKHGVPFGIFCEGTHRMKHSILPLVKGIFRIAIQADEALQGEMPVYIVPIGIEYGSYTRYRSTIAVQVGEAFNVSEFNKRHSDKTQPELMNIMREELSCRISSLYHCVPDDEDYEGMLHLCYLRNNEQSPHARMLANRKTVDELLQLKGTNPEQFKEQMLKAQQFATLCRELNISDETLYCSPSHKKNLLRMLELVVTLPYFIFCGIIDLPVALVTWLLFHFVIEDEAMKNSLRLAIIMLFYPFIFIGLAVFLFQYFAWPVSLVLLLLALPANCFVHHYAKVVRLMKSDYRYLKSTELQSKVK